MKIYLVKDDYTPDYPTVYGAYTTLEIAKQVIKLLSSENNPYGCSQNENDTLEVETLTVYDTPVV